MTALFWKDKPVGDMEGRWIVRGEGGNRELVQRLLPGKGDEARTLPFQPAFFNPFSKAHSSAYSAPLLFLLLLFFVLLPEHLSDI